MFRTTLSSVVAVLFTCCLLTANAANAQSKIVFAKNGKVVKVGGTHHKFKPIVSKPPSFYWPKPVKVYKPVIVPPKPVFCPTTPPIVINPPITIPPVTIPPTTLPPVTPPTPVVNVCQPKHCYAWACPGESLDQICLREYGDATLWPHVVKYNNITGALDVSVPIMLPNIYTNGLLTASSAPAPPKPNSAPVATLANAALPPVAQ